jgi:hypothetical protein
MSTFKRINSKIQNFVNRCPEHKWWRLLVPLAFLFDILSCWNLLEVWRVKNLPDHVLRLVFQQQGISLAEVDQQLIEEIKGLATLGLSSLFTLFLLVTSLFYVAALFGKEWGRSYVRSYIGFAAILSLVMLWDDQGLGVTWFALNCLATFYYFCAFIILRKCSNTNKYLGRVPI